MGEYVLLFIEGILAFVSPCFLPMIPVYLTYLVGQGNQDQKKLLANALGFILGFTLVFVTLGMSATQLSKFFVEERLLFQRIGGVLLILFGLNMAGFFRLGLLNRDKRLAMNVRKQGFFPSILFGIIISFGWSPCLGAFLGAALVQAGSSGTLWIGGLKLLIFSFGIAVPFLISALLFNNLTGVFTAIKKHYGAISLISGLFLILMGILMILDRFIWYANIFY